MNTIYAERLGALRALMMQRGWDAVVVSGSDPHGSEYPAPRWKQVRWLCGFGGEGDIVVTRDHAGLWTDSRYFLEADRILPGTGFELHKTRVPDEVPIPEWLAAYAEDRPLAVALDGVSQSRAFVGRIAACAGEEVRLLDVPDLLDDLWPDRPGIPQSPVLTLGDEMSGESRADKILWLRNFIIEKGCDAILLSALDEIAWMLNVRGSDIAFNPLVVSYLLVTLDEVVWYVRKGGPLDEETAASFAELEADGITLLRYDEVDLDLATRQGDGTIRRLYADPGSLNWHLSQILSGPVETGPSPVPLRKACKNEIEAEGMREACLEDGVAMEEFLCWLERRLEYGEPVSERDAADRLGMLRARIPGYRGDSFETISAYGPGAALPHYVTPEEDAPVLEQRGLYLCDSGGQYLFGTTDLTRTVPLGECTALEKEDYTLVLKGHIALAMAVFPKGTAGCQIDVLARGPLWTAKRNYGHGTGHGVGSFLCVHEGPQDIRQNFNAQPLLPGMVTSDEPGIYREGLHGVRHESLLLCKELGRNDFGQWLGFEVLTLCHIDTAPVLPELLTARERAWLNAYNRRVFDTLSPRLDADTAAWLREKCRPL